MCGKWSIKFNCEEIWCWSVVSWHSVTTTSTALTTTLVVSRRIGVVQSDEFNCLGQSVQCGLQQWLKSGRSSATYEKIWYSFVRAWREAMTNSISSDH